MWPDPPGNVTLAEEILNRNLHFLCSVRTSKIFIMAYSVKVTLALKFDFHSFTNHSLSFYLFDAF